SAELKLTQLQQRLQSHSGMHLHWDASVPTRIVERCTEVETGARNIDFILSGSVLPHLAREILQRMSTETVPTAVTLAVDASGSFSIRFENTETKESL
ncbi:MAG: hypothetical protein RR317_04855, partial [Bilophila sp.]